MARPAHPFPCLSKEETVYHTVLQRQPLPVHQTRIPGLDIVPSHILVSNTDIELTVAKDHREARLKTQLDAIRDQYEYILIDCPPTLSWLTLNAFTASDKVIVVVAPGYFELDSIVQIAKVIDEVKEYFQKYPPKKSADKLRNRGPTAFSVSLG